MGVGEKKAARAVLLRSATHCIGSLGTPLDENCVECNDRCFRKRRKQKTLNGGLCNTVPLVL